MLIPPSSEGLEDRLKRVEQEGLVPVTVDHNNGTNYSGANGRPEPGQYYQMSMPEGLTVKDYVTIRGKPEVLVPSRSVELAAVLSNALQDDYLGDLAQRAGQTFPTNPHAKPMFSPGNSDIRSRITIGGLLGSVSSGLFSMFPAPVVDLYLDSEGYHFFDLVRKETVDLPWGASFDAVLPHAVGLVSEYGSWLPDMRQVAFTITNNAYNLETNLLPKPQGQRRSEHGL